MLTWPKAGSINSRVIVNFSWPHGKSINDRVSNDQYMGTVFKLKFPTVDDITDRITYLNDDCLLYNIDLQDPFAISDYTPKTLIGWAFSIRVTPI